MGDAPASLRERVHEVLADLAFRTTAVLDRIHLRWTLPAPVADGWRRSSRYLPMRDGTRIAIDVYRPTRRGVTLDAPAPVIWSYERYHRARIDGRRLRTRLDSEFWLSLMLRHGYVVAIADARGCGASFGVRRAVVSDQDAEDAYDITEWLAAQPWSNGRIGMFGKSFMGMAQLLAASVAPPHLAAILPEKTLFDLYSFAYPGGVLRDDYAKAWGSNARSLDRLTPAAPVDEDAAGTLRDEAMREHDDNVDIHPFFAARPFRDGPAEDGGDPPFEEQSPARRIDAISRSGIPVFQVAGWLDMWPRDALLWHRNLTNPRKLLIGPWPHTYESWKLAPERMRWFDHWLKGIDTGVMRMPAIRYHTSGARRRSAWRGTDQWPLSDERPTSYYLEPAGRLGTVVPTADAGGADRYVVDYTTTSGTRSRWRNGYGQPFRYPDMRDNDAKALTYTSLPLRDDLEVTGHPTACLWVSASVADVDLFIYLEELTRTGRSLYVTEGVLRASHRAECEPPHDQLGLPYHRGYAADACPLPSSEPVLLRLDLLPCSHVFRRGRRLRIAIAGADRHNALTIPVTPAPELTVHRSLACPSHLILPVIPRGARARR